MVLVYLDDLIIWALNFEEHQVRLNVVLKRLQDTNLTLTSSKCRFGESKIKYLGHIISADGVVVDPEKVSAVTKFPVPSNQTHIRSFVNLCGYYRRFIRNFGKLAAPLNLLLRKDQPFEWKEAQESAFQKMKLAIVTSPVLAYPLENCLTEIHCDSSGYGIGSTLIQIQNEKPRVIAYASRAMTEVEKRYTASEQECLAVIYSVQKFRPYIFGIHSKVFTDHSALKWLFSVKDPHRRLARWSFLLQTHDMTIIHRPGKNSNDADPLSRYPVDPPESMDSSEVLLLENIDMRAKQLEDPWSRKIIEYIEQKERNLDDESEGHHPPAQNIQDYSMQNGILYIANFDSNDRSWRLVIPKGLRKDVLLSVHADELGGHLGMTKTWTLIKSRFFWKGIFKATRRFILGCKACQLHRTRRGPEYGLMQSFAEVDAPFQRVGIDFIGPFPTSKNNNKHALIFVDYFSRYIESKPVPEATARAVVDAIKEKIILRHSLPKEFIVDRCRQFTSELLKLAKEKLRYKIKFTAPYHPQTNGMTERANQTLKHTIAKFASPNQKNWDDCLSSATFAYNVSRQESTMFSPFFLVHGREPRLPVDLELPVNSEIEIQKEFPKELNSARMQAQRNSRQAHLKSKVRFDKRMKNKHFALGEKVLRSVPVRKKVSRTNCLHKKLAVLR